MKQSIERVFLFRANASMQLTPAEGEKQVKTKFTYALEKMISRTNEYEKKYQSFLEDARVDLASEDDKKNLIVNEKGQFSFTRENHKLLNQKIREKQKELVEIEPYFVDPKHIPEDLNVSLKEMFIGFVIKDEEEEPQEEESKVPTPELN